MNLANQLLSRRLPCTLLLPAVALIVGCEPPAPPAPPPMEIAVLEVEPRSVPIYFDMIGQTSGSVDIPIRARVDGVLEGKRIGKRPHWNCGAPQGVVGSSPMPSASGMNGSTLDYRP